MAAKIPREQRLELLVRARLYGAREAAEWGGVSSAAIRGWAATDPELVREAEEAARGLRGRWLEELEASCAEAARAVTTLTRRHVALACSVLDDPGATEHPGQDPMTDVERLRLSAEVLADLRAVVAGAAETLTHYTAVCGAPATAPSKPGLRAA